jgi:hypothetical protein
MGVCPADRRTQEVATDGAAAARLVALETENAQLRTALRTRIVIEQAKGVLAERLGVSPEDAFQLLRAASRRTRRRIHDSAAEIVTSPSTPRWLEVELARRRPAHPRRTTAADPSGIRTAAS